ncbi:acetyltransferase [Dehalobacter sp. MCB1]|nr:acetyltransferase [Dehalobacter sp. MCB1]TCX51870.1 acetyltransferase [Dehalobacter sp. 14DCB1]TCX52930.1 acetyltransferase [Dehalobacter sp. 12DCB1]
MLMISPQAKISPLADIEDSIRGSKISIAPGVVIDSFVKIKPAGGMGDIEIGENSFINSGVVIYSGNGVKIGRDVLIAANCTFAPVNHEYHARNQKIVDQGFMPSRGGIFVGDDVWIGANCVILDGAHIGTGTVIGAHSIVSGKLEDYGVYYGHPLRLKEYRE